MEWLMMKHWQWSVEILVISIVVYYAWKLLRGTRGARVMSGLLILMLVLSLLAIVFKLTVVVEILRFFSASFVMVLVVIFQPELRRMLAELGSQRYQSAGHQQSEVIEEVVNALEVLQRERFGALIAFEREVVFQAGRDSGTDIDAKVTEDLLATIFYPRTPLHDGGVLIHNDRIVTAAAIFPVTQQEGLHRTLGLRHRSALGLSEETDAVIVVLSEETGQISIAFEGRLERLANFDLLRARLTEILLGSKKKPNETPKPPEALAA
jgi:diadenylate cyclase